MHLPEPDYISMEEAAKKFEVSVEHLRWLAEEQKLTVYVKPGPNQYAKLKAPRWELDRLASDLPYCMAVYVDNTGTPVANGTKLVYSPGSDCSRIYVKIKELKLLEQEYLDRMRQVTQPTQEFLVSLRDELKAEGLSDSAIAKKLKQKFPNLKDSRIGRLLPANPGTTVSYDADRKRGARLLKEAPSSQEKNKAN